MVSQMRTACNCCVERIVCMYVTDVRKCIYTPLCDAQIRAVPCNYSEEGMQFSCLADALQGRDTAAYMIVHVHAEILSEPAITLWTSGQ